MGEESVSAYRARQLPVAAHVKVIASTGMFERIRKLHDKIARRAYELWKEDGCPSGPNLEYWLRAESEMFCPTHVELQNADDRIVVRVEAPGFTHKDLTVSVRGRRLMMVGKREPEQTGSYYSKILSNEPCSDQLLRVIDLPANVNAAKTTAWLRDGILEITLPKAKPAPKIPLLSRTM